MAEFDMSDLLKDASLVTGIDGVQFSHGLSKGELTFEWDATRYTDDEVRDAKQRVVDLLKRGGITILNVANPSARQLDLRIPDSELDRLSPTAPRRKLPPR